MRGTKQGRLRSRKAEPIAPDRYVTTFAARDGGTEIAHLDGIPWHEAPLPPKRHACWPQTAGFVRYFTYVERCACGAVNYDCLGRDPRWQDRNSRQSPEDCS
jgi:hypothetical protein